ncbi:MAG: hypothetical protein B1H07_04870 [Campylobacteraceae bacterium 4484_166]|nr:MAG: hypothetical protein B1H07_04870 [Campylobacteraceae bacterium 4484_166]
MDTSMIYQALIFMLLGMGVVFIFLTIMIYVLKLQAYLIAKFVKDDIKVQNKLKEKIKNDNSNDSIIAAITGAILYHNNRRV